MHSNTNPTVAVVLVDDDELELEVVMAESTMTRTAGGQQSLSDAATDIVAVQVREELELEDEDALYTPTETGRELVARWRAERWLYGRELCQDE